MRELLQFPAHNFLNRFLEYLPKNNNREFEVLYNSHETPGSVKGKYSCIKAVEHSITTPGNLETDIALVWCDTSLEPLFDIEKTKMFLLCQAYQFYRKLKNQHFSPIFIDMKRKRAIDFSSKEREINEILHREFEPLGLVGHEYIIIGEEGLASRQMSYKQRIQ